MESKKPTSGRGRAARAILLGAALLLLLVHARIYAFLTDDAFISFRYARNLAEGQGLVFNPGLERVEGYTNFLWVIVLSVFHRLGAAPEHAANVLSVLLTVALWALVARRSVADAEPGEPAWVTALPCLLLAVTRSIAVWSTGGLETRLFEVLVVAATFRLLDETVSEGRGNTLRRPWSGVLFGLATLTRPDGLLVAGSAMATAAGWLLLRGRFAWRPWIGRAGAFVALAGGHLAFRLAYYGEWVPNTYFAKVGGRAWWEMGFRYAGCFVLEYAVALWLPLLVLGVRRHLRGGTPLTPALYAAVVIPHFLYIVSIGGDHFEYRPLDLYFPFAYLLMADGARAWLRARRKLLAAVAVAAVIVGLVWIPAQSHLQYPRDHYRPVFPGGAKDDDVAQRFLDPSRDPLLRWPGLRSVAELHRRLLNATTDRVVGIRQEEHRFFYEAVRAQGEWLRELERAGRVPGNLYIALSSVGAVPYYSGLPTLDRLGLTDAWVARAPLLGNERAMAHDRRDTFEYARRRGVHLSSVRAAQIVFSPGDPILLPVISAATLGGRTPAFAFVGPDALLVGVLPQGLDRTRAELPSLEFRDLGDPAALSDLVARATAALRETARREPDNVDALSALGQALLLAGDAAGARAVLEPLSARAPERISVWRALCGARAASGDRDGAVLAVERAMSLAEARSARDLLAELQRVAAKVRQLPPSAR